VFRDQLENRRDLLKGWLTFRRGQIYRYQCLVVLYDTYQASDLLSPLYSLHSLDLVVRMSWEGFEHTLVPLQDSLIGEYKLHAVAKGNGPPLMLLHGYVCLKLWCSQKRAYVSHRFPQTYYIWHRIANQLAAKCVTPDSFLLHSSRVSLALKGSPSSLWIFEVMELRQSPKDQARMSSTPNERWPRMLLLLRKPRIPQSFAYKLMNRIANTLAFRPFTASHMLVSSIGVPEDSSIITGSRRSSRSSISPGLSQRSQQAHAPGHLSHVASF